MSKSYCFSVESIACVSCAAPIRNALLSDPNNIKVYVDVTTKRVYVLRNDDESINNHVEQKFKQTIEGIGHEYNGLVDLAGIVRQHWWKGALAILAGFGILAISAFGLGIPLLAMYIIGGVATALTIFVGRDTYIRAFKKLWQEKDVSMDALFAISTIAALLVSISGCCLPFLGLPMLFDAALLIFGFRHVGKAIEEQAKEKVMAGLSFYSRLPHKVVILRDGQEQEILLADVIENDIVLVPADAMIPVDGVCVSEKATIFDTIKTGEKDPKEINCNAELLAGMVAQTACHVRVTQTAKNSYLAQLDNQIDQARMTRQAEIEDQAGKALRYFIPCVLLLAVIALILVSCFLSPVMGLQCGIAVLVAACPCILGFIVPISIKIGMTKAAEHKAYFTNGQALQAAASVKTIVFDLNGTLTRGQPRVIKHEIINDCEDSLHKIAAIENFYAQQCQQQNKRQHGYAKLLQSYVESKGQIPNDNAQIILDENCRSGLSGTLNGQRFYLGNSDLMRQAGIELDVCHVISARQSNCHYIYFALDGQVKTFFTIHDQLRPEAKTVVHQLKAQGIRTRICTGTNRETALAYAHVLGIDSSDVQANCLAEEKSKYIETIKSQEEGGIAMVGDEGNDAPAIARSDFGIAIKPNLDMKGYEIAREGAQAIIEEGSLYPILAAMEIASQTMTNIKQNLTVSITYNLTACLIAGGVLLVVGIALNPGIAAALMILQTLLVLSNVYRLRCQSVSDKTQAKEFELYGIDKNQNFATDLSHPPVWNPSAHPSDNTMLEQSLANGYSSTKVLQNNNVRAAEPSFNPNAHDCTEYANVH